MMIKVSIVFFCIIVYMKANSDSNFKACDNGYGLCVPFYRCNNTQELGNDSDLTVLSSESECEDYFEACCTPDKVLVINMF